MGDLKLSLVKPVAGISQPIGVILIWKILTEEGAPALPSEQTPLQDGLENEGCILQISFFEKVFQCGGINPFDPLLHGNQSIQPLSQ